MYSTCLFCNRPLGSNEALEHFPVGRRLAFDAAKGRLWVICLACARWNLTPLEERWEAVEEAERLFRESRLRVSTDHIGLARVADGTDLVRIGRPERPEFAAWRYGDQFTKRRKKYLVVAGAAAVAGAGAIAGGVTAGLGIVTAYQIGSVFWKFSQRGFPASVVARFRDSAGTLVRVRRHHLAKSSIGTASDGSFALSVTHGDGVTTLEGEQARRVAASILPAVNRGGGTPEEVQTAVERLARAGSVEDFLTKTVNHCARLTRPKSPGKSPPRPGEGVLEDTGLLALGTTLGLALEMALHEEQERRALEGELAELELAWQEAEEIGAIADDLFLPAEVERVLERLRLR